MVYWFNGLMGFHMEKTIGLLVYWFNGLMVYWFNGLPNVFRNNPHVSKHTTSHLQDTICVSTLKKKSQILGPEVFQ